MRKVLCAVLLLPILGCGRKPEFKEFSSPEGKFSILMPGNPEKKEQNVKGIKMVSYGVETKAWSYGVAYGDMLPNTTFSPSGAVQGIASVFQGKVLSEKDFTFEGATGKEFEIESTKPKGHVSGRIIVINNRIYQYFVGGNERLSGENVQKFLNSFKLIK
jgi:hypothetical protein